MTTARLETFSDGVFAIAATLLILNVHVSGAPLGHQLLRAWPAYGAYAVSFVTIGIMWINHHTVFAQIARVDRTFLVVNVFFLMTIAFVPFPTGEVAAHLQGEGAKAAAIAYGSTLTVTAILYNLLWLYASTGYRLLSPEADPKVVSGISRTYRPGPFMYGAATLVALGSPVASVILFAALAVFYIIESSFFGRSRDSSTSARGPDQEIRRG